MAAVGTAALIGSIGSSVGADPAPAQPIGQYSSGYEADFSQASTKGAGFTFKKTGTPYFVSFWLDGFAKGAPQRTGNRYRFQPSGGFAIDYTDSGSSIKEDVILAHRPPFNSVTFSTAWHDDLQLRREDGGFQLLDPAGNVVFAVPRPVVHDATGRGGTATLTIQDGKATLGVDAVFLDTATYPVTIDPQAIGSGGLLAGNGRSVATAGDRALAIYRGDVECNTTAVSCLKGGTYASGSWQWDTLPSTLSGGTPADVTMPSSSKAFIVGRDSAGASAILWEGTRTGSTWAWSTPKTIAVVASASEMDVLTTLVGSTTRVWVAYRGSDGVSTKKRVSYSDNGGTTWTTVNVSTDGSTSGVALAKAYGTNGGAAFVVYRDAGAGSVRDLKRALISTAGTLFPAITITSQADVYPPQIVDDGGNDLVYHLVYPRLVSSKYRLEECRTSSLDLDDWTCGTVIHADVRYDPVLPSFAVAGDRGRVAASYIPSTTAAANAGDGVLKAYFDGAWAGEMVYQDAASDELSSALDAVGNEVASLVRSASQIYPLELDLPPIVSSLTSTPGRFSPTTSDAACKTTTFATTAFEEAVSWVVDVKNAGGTVVRTYTQPSSSTGAVSQAWDGKNGAGTVQPDGTYTAEARVTDVAPWTVIRQQTVVLDTTAPVPSAFAASNPAFSPNGDGVKDTTTFTGAFSETASWKITIKNQSGTTVRELTGASAGSLPATTWDGKNTAGTVQPDGTYTATLSLTDLACNASVSTVSASVVVDTVAPAISGLAASNPVFSPNADGTKDSTTISATLTDPSTPVAWSVNVKNASNATVRTYTGSGSPLSQAWDGKNGSGTVQPDGTYTVVVQATDAAGVSSTQSTTVIVDTTAPSIGSYARSNPVFSPNADATKDTTTFSATLSDTNAVTWSLAVKNASNTTVRTYTGSASPVSQAWDGKNGSGTVQPDGTYTAALTATDAGGNATSSSLTVDVDTAGPTISGLAASNPAFSPNGDYTKEDTTISATLADPHGPLTWTMNVKTGGGSVVRSYSGSGSPVSQVWDGRNGSAVVQPDGTYAVELKAIDDGGAARTSTVSVTIDNVAPAISGLAASNPVFSPNADGTKDSTTVSATLTDPSTPIAWTLTVRNSSGGAVRTYTGSGSPVAQAWDGKNDWNTMMPDGTYTVELLATDAAGVNATQSTTVTIDTTAPAISSYAASHPTFSPNADGTKDTTTFSATLSDSNAVTWSMAVKNASNTTVRTFTGSASPVSQAWDGKNGSGTVQPDGTYTAALTATDPGGNATTSSLTVDVDTAGPTISGLVASNPAFSPNGDSAKDTTTVSATLADPHGPLSWTMEVKTGGGSVVRSYSGSGTSVSQVWDGKNATGLVQPDGTYTVALTALDDGGAARTQSISVVLDTTPPTVSELSVSTDPFSPNDDSKKDTTTLSATLADGNGPISWVVDVKSGAGATVRTYSGSGTAILQLWDGKNGSGTVQPDGTYTFDVRAVDAAGVSTLSPKTVALDTTPPAISGYSASNGGFSPNGDGIKDTTTIAATLTDPSTPLTWSVRISATGATVREFAGTGSNVSAAWDGRDQNGLIQPDGLYEVVLEAKDDVQVIGVARLSITVDTTPPTIEAVAPLHRGSTALPTQSIVARATDAPLSAGTAVSGIDPTSARVQVGGVPVSAAVTSGVLRSAAIPMAAGQSYHADVDVRDFAGNAAGTLSLDFKATSVTVPPVVAKIDRHVATSSVANGDGTRTFKFEQVPIRLPKYDATVSGSRAHPGFGYLAQRIDLTKAKIRLYSSNALAGDVFLAELPAPSQWATRTAYGQAVDTHWNNASHTVSVNALTVWAPTLEAVVPVTVADKAELVLGADGALNTAGFTPACGDPTGLCDRLYPTPDAFPYYLLEEDAMYFNQKWEDLVGRFRQGWQDVVAESGDPDPCPLPGDVTNCFELDAWVPGLLSPIVWNAIDQAWDLVPTVSPGQAFELLQYPPTYPFLDSVSHTESCHTVDCQSVQDVGRNQYCLDENNNPSRERPCTQYVRATVVHANGPRPEPDGDGDEYWKTHFWSAQMDATIGFNEGASDVKDELALGLHGETDSEQAGWRKVTTGRFYSRTSGYYAGQNKVCHPIFDDVASPPPSDEAVTTYAWKAKWFGHKHENLPHSTRFYLEHICNEDWPRWNRLYNAYIDSWGAYGPYPTGVRQGRAVAAFGHRKYALDWEFGCGPGFGVGVPGGAGVGISCGWSAQDSSRRAWTLEAETNFAY